MPAISYVRNLGRANRHLFAALTLLISIPDLDTSAAAAVGLCQSSGAHAVIATLSSNPQLANFYEINWQVIPT